MHFVKNTNSKIKSNSLIEATMVDSNIRIQNMIERTEILPTISYAILTSRNYTYSFFTI